MRARVVPGRGEGGGVSDRTGNGSKLLRRYRVSDDKGYYVGTFVIADDGYFSTVSEWGNYAYYWSHAGACFRSALANFDGDYVLNKIARRDVYDGEATGADVRRHILEYRRDGHMTKEEAREEWDLFIEHERLESRECFAWWYRDTKIGDASEFASHDYPSQAKWFSVKAWPHFVKALRAELAAEKGEPE